MLKIFAKIEKSAEQKAQSREQGAWGMGQGAWSKGGPSVKK